MSKVTSIVPVQDAYENINIAIDMMISIKRKEENRGEWKKEINRGKEMIKKKKKKY